MNGIAAAATGASQMQLQQKVSVSVMKMAMDDMETQGAGVVQMMESSVQPHLGGSIDFRA